MAIIEVNNLSKKYYIRHEKLPYYSLRDELVNVALKPIRWIEGHREQKEEVWALRDINFEVQKGEVVGVIGSNGAGKSTLLKILSRITFPTHGEARLRGSAASLLEVGLGFFHQELTGRENVYMNGSILGMTRKEVQKKFHDIVEFAGIARFLDAPMKRYSTGMSMRLAFSIAAHLEPDILFVDEVLAVGDAAFQKKCLGKMDEAHRKEGRTIIFVSHNMDALRALCERCIWIEGGKIVGEGDTEKVVNAYMRSVA